MEFQLGENRLVWSDELGDLRKKKNDREEETVDELKLILKLRRLTSGKGRSIIEITELPQNKKWCQNLAKEIKKSIGVGGAYKENYIEIHGEKMEAVMGFLDKKKIKYKKIGG